MRDLLRGISLGVILATGLLAYVHYTNPEEAVTKEKEYTIDGAIAFLEKQEYEITKKEADKPKSSAEKQPEENMDDVEEKEETVEEPEESTEASIKEYELVIQSGMSSIDVSDLLYENGIVDDATEFNQYLETQGYQSIIGVGTYQVTDQMSYEQIATIITN
ncbi:MltG/YceG/YrrL family protein [Ornithinibacillus contaminans]|uniref:endolytic transglycosylase MltG n=1 Tax=Ornithinibacillus contaminans TaxID=694055 RepID=UPI00064E104B|nr:endolytic transglycosylase MltG [Ornithinibacillus contaminans]